ncbi:MAG TPA: hypothetical protein VMU73_08945, partial [Gaiellaceae bacterium]|nr:hypothetical protein [Gaiellaceae bacterium]
MELDTEPDPNRGAIPEPEFADELPERGIRYRPSYRYEKMLDAVRKRPGTPAKIAEFTHGNSQRTLLDLRTEHRSLWGYLHRNYPLEAWSVHQRRVTNTWSARELWIIYHGTVTPEERRQLNEAKSAIWQRGRANGTRKRAARELAKALEERAQRRALGG